MNSVPEWIQRTDAKYILVIILVLFFLFEAANLNFNTIFTDESQYLIIGNELRDIYDFGGDPPRYIFGSTLFPLIYGIMDLIGGLFAARLLSVILATGTSFFVYLTSRELLDRKLALVSLSIFVLNAPFIFVSRMVSFEIFSIFFLSAGFYFAIAGSKNKGFYLSPISFFFSVISKYIAIIYTVVLFPFIYSKNKKKGLYFLIVFLLFLSIYAILFFSSLISLLSFFSDKHLNSLAQIDITRFISILFYFVIPFSLALLAKNRIKEWKYLLFGSLLMFIFHVFTFNFEYTMFKHMAYPFIFLSPLMAAGIVRLRVKIGGIVLIAFVISSGFFVYYLDRSYPNISEPVDYIRSMPDANIILGESNSYIYYFMREPNKQTHATFYLDYDGDTLSTFNDFKEAVDNRFFDIIVLDGFFTPDLSRDIEDILPGKYYLNKTFNSKLHFGDSFTINLYRRV